MHAAERFRLRIESPAMNVGERLTVTASFGIASLTPEIQTPEAWLARADLPLYKAKTEGRNRCHQADASRDNPCRSDALAGRARCADQLSN